MNHGKQRFDSYNKIVPGLYLGDKKAVQDMNLISKLHLTHIVTADLIPLPRIVTSTYPNLAILHLPIADLEDTDLLTHLEDTHDFIREALGKDGAVLVHCYNGISRSASIVIAFLMKLKRMEYERALSMVVRARPCVCPNEGFKMQLKLLAKMSWRLDASFPAFKYYKLTLIRNQFCKTDILPPEARQMQQEETTWDDKTAALCLRSKGSLFRCKFCRSILFNQSNVLPHRRGASANWQSMVQQDITTPNSKITSNAELCCQGIFVEPLQWMTKYCYNSKSGLLCCFRCRNKLGLFHWTDFVVCSCRAKLSPGFFIKGSKVDRCTMLKEIEANL